MPSPPRPEALTRSIRSGKPVPSHARKSPSFGPAGTGTCGTSSTQPSGATAHHVVDHTQADPTEGRHRYDVILDIGGNRPPSQLRRALPPTGRPVIIGGETDGRWLGGIDRQFRAHLLSPFASQELGTFVASENAEDLAVLRELNETGRISPVIDQTYPLREAPTAVRYMLDGHTRGKLTITL